MSVDKRDDVRNHYVYRYYDADGWLMYVGCTVRPKARLVEHRNQRPGMCAAIAEVKLSGPYSYRIARELERQALSTEEPICGSTPEKDAEKRVRDAWIDTRSRRLMAAGDGMTFTQAIRVAVAEADEWFPDPMESPYDPPMRRLRALAGGVA